ncbi:hypothetical protein [Streptomyces sp. NPDC026673]|uniref:hypothetical protein n=1 Tax=Streptomyces sp. NPDC026673 TaxID=3155724 RepID=UPI0033E5DD5D
MPRGFPLPMAPVDIKEILRRIVQRHDAADDPDLELFPDPDARADELELVALTLLAASKNTKHLPRVQRGPEVTDRLTLIRRLRQLLDDAELRALRDGRTAGVAWVRLGAPLGITTKNGVMQRLQRLRVASELGASVPRHPRSLRNAVRTRASDEERLQSWIAQHYIDVREAATDLIAQRESLLTDDGVDEWLDDLEELLDKRQTEQRRRSVASHLRFAVEGILELAESSGQAPARTTRAHHVLARAGVLATSYRRR